MSATEAMCLSGRGRSAGSDGPLSARMRLVREPRSPRVCAAERTVMDGVAGGRERLAAGRREAQVPPDGVHRLQQLPAVDGRRVGQRHRGGHVGALSLERLHDGRVAPERPTTRVRASGLFREHERLAIVAPGRADPHSSTAPLSSSIARRPSATARSSIGRGWNWHRTEPPRCLGLAGMLLPSIRAHWPYNGLELPQVVGDHGVHGRGGIVRPAAVGPKQRPVVAPPEGGFQVLPQAACTGHRHTVHAAVNDACRRSAPASGGGGRTWT